MPYLKFDLDAKKRAARSARAAGVEPGTIAWGLLELWEHAWEAKSDVVGEIVLDGCFGPSGRIREALEAYGFLEPADGRWRVKGAAKYLGVSEARSAAGKTRAANAERDQQGRLVTSKPPASAGEATSKTPALPPIHPSTQTPIHPEEEAPPPELKAGGTPTAPDKPPEQWDGQDFQAFFQDRRVAGGLVPEKPQPPGKLSGWFNRVRMTQGMTVKRLIAAVYAFGEDKYWEQRGYPLAAFMSAWERYVQAEVAHVAA